MRISRTSTIDVLVSSVPPAAPKATPATAPPRTTALAIDARLPHTWRSDPLYELGWLLDERRPAVAQRVCGAAGSEEGDRDQRDQQRGGHAVRGGRDVV